MTKSDRILGIVLALFVLCTWLPRLKGPIDLRWDAAGKYILGMSLAEGKSYRLLNEPGEIRSIQDPPFLSLVAAGFIKVLGTKDPLVVGHGLRILYLFLHVGLILLTYFFARQFLPPLYSFFAAFMLILSTAILFASDIFWSEIPFAVLTVLVLLLSYKARPIGSVAQFLLMSVLFFLRTAGVALFAAWVVESLFQRKWKIAITRFAAAVIPIFLWFGYTASVKSSAEYQAPAYSYQRSGYIYSNTDYFTYVRLKGPLRLESQIESPAQTLHRFLVNVQKAPAKIFSTMAVDYSNLEHVFARNPLPSFFPERIYYYIPFVLGVISLCGVAFFVSKKQWMIVFFLLFYLPPVFIWPFTDEMYRLLIPVAPIFAVAFVRMMLLIKDALAKYFRISYWSHVPGLAILFAVFVLQGVVFSYLYRFDHQEVVSKNEKGESVSFRLFYYNPAQKSLDQTLEWFRTNGKPDRIIVAMNPEHVYLKTGMKSVVPPYTSDVAGATRFLNSIPAGYLLLDAGHPKLTIEFTAPIVSASPQDWKQVYAAPKTVQQSLHAYQKQANWRQDNVPLDVPGIYERTNSLANGPTHSNEPPE